jgi:hypothetical protein
MAGAARLMLGLLLGAPVLAQQVLPAASAVVVAPEVPPATSKVAPKAAPKAASSPDPARGLTPNAQRLVSIGAINKRTGQSRTFTLHPGETFDFAALRVTVRTCETTPPWEQRLTGAFLLIDETMVNAPAKRVFSGWMFAESPSLHPLEHPRYDIWVKSCVMRFPETGPATVAAGRAAAPSNGRAAAPSGDRAAAPSGERVVSPSSAKKSAESPSAAPN